METQIEFIKATVADVDKFVEIEKTAIGQKTYSGIIDREEAIKEIEDNEVYFIYRDNQLTGSTEYQVKNENEAYLGGLVIRPEFQGQGIARKAAMFRMEKLKDIHHVWLVTHPQNSKIITLYLSLGFTIESWKDNYFGDGEPRLVLARTKSS